MIRNDKLLFGALSAAAILIPLILILEEGWSWSYLLLGAGLLVLVAVIRMYQMFRRDQQNQSDELPELPAAPEPPPPPVQERVLEIDLPTNTPDYRMLFSSVVLWRPIAASGESLSGHLGALAKQAIVERAVAIVQDASPSDVSVTKHRLAGLLSVPQPDSTTQVRACATDVTLTIRDEDADWIRAVSDLRKKSEVWEQEREYERNVRKYLGDDALTTSARALVWWMARHMDNIEGAVALISHLSRISAVSQGREDAITVGPRIGTASSSEHGNEDRDTAATRELLNELFPDSADQRAFFALKLAKVADECGQNGYGQRLRQIFGVQDMHEDPPDAGDDQPTDD